MNLKKIIFTSLILTSTIYADQFKNLENTLKNKDINLELKIQENSQEYINSKKMSENDIKYPFHMKFRKFEKNVKETIKNYGLKGGHSKGEYFAVSQDCFFNSICYGASIIPSKNASMFIIRFK